MGPSPRSRTGAAARALVAVVACLWPALVPGPVAARAPVDRPASVLVPPRPTMRVLRAVAIPTGSVERGIDVSHWQGVIDWPSVRAVGVRFAWIKATEGTTFLDIRFHANRAAATAAGIRVGAYHYARPSGVPGDATAEADAFLDAVRPVTGELLPALDLEETGGLEPAALTRWALEFIARVRERTGLSPVIYTSPAFWTTNLGDTQAAALWAAPLWLAHWDTDEARVPAGDWRGRGWSVWQWSDVGLVPGIYGVVDLDVVRAGTLDELTIH